MRPREAGAQEAGFAMWLQGSACREAQVVPDPDRCSEGPADSMLHEHGGLRARNERRQGKESVPARYEGHVCIQGYAPSVVPGWLQDPGVRPLALDVVDHRFRGTPDDVASGSRSRMSRTGWSRSGFTGSCSLLEESVLATGSAAPEHARHSGAAWRKGAARPRSPSA